MNYPAPFLQQCGCVASCVIFGHQSLQNVLLARLIEGHLDIPCGIAAHNEADVSGLPHGALALLDAGTSVQQALETQVSAIHLRISVIAVFNAPPNQALDRLLRWPKVKGLFYENTHEEQFLKGIQSLCMNEYWLPRKVLAKYLEETRSTQHHPTTTDASLTPKETQILRAMISGAKNSDIAEILHVSPHTIKTHVYNLFRKIKVSNRVQAVSWALANLEHRA